MERVTGIANFPSRQGAYFSRTPELPNQVMRMATKAVGMGFGDLPREEAAHISSDDRLLIILSRVMNRDLSAWLEMWDINLTAGAKAQVAEQGYTDAPFVYYAMTPEQACDTFDATPVAVDGASGWPL